jgi:hypothetical protein
MEVEVGNGVGSFSIEGLPIVHKKVRQQTSKEITVAGKWAWSCVCDLEKAFLEVGRVDGAKRLDRTSCDAPWFREQKKLHEAFAFLPAIDWGVDGCAACAIARALTILSILESYGVAATERAGPLTDFLLDLDFDTLPAIPPPVFDTVTSTLKPVQSILCSLLVLAQKEDSTRLKPGYAATLADGLCWALSKLFHAMGMYRMAFIYVAQLFCLTGMVSHGFSPHPHHWTPCHHAEGQRIADNHFCMAHKLHMCAHKRVKRGGRARRQDADFDQDCMEYSAKAVIEACAEVSIHDIQGQHQKVTECAIEVVREYGKGFQYPCDYLTHLDEVTHLVDISLSLHMPPTCQLTCSGIGTTCQTRAPNSSEPSLFTSHAGGAAPTDAGLVVVELVRNQDGWHWFVDGEDRGIVATRENTIRYKISHILFNQVGAGWIPHKTFMNATGWTPAEYFDQTGQTGAMQKQLRRLRRILGFEIVFSKEKGVRFPDRVVNYPKHYPGKF